MVQLVYLLVVLGSAIWVAVDAKRLGAKRGVLGGGFLDMGPAAWFFCVLIVWIVGLVAYLVTRPKYVALRAGGLSAVPLPGASAYRGAPPLPAAGPPPGWYPDPVVPGRQRWWSGDRWGAQAVAPPPQQPPPPASGPFAAPPGPAVSWAPAGGVAGARTCARCGAPAPGGASFCGSCGAAL